MADASGKQWGGLAPEGTERFPKGEYTGKGYEFKPEDANIPEDAPVYHGTSHTFEKGDYIKPSYSKFRGVPNVAYGTQSLQAAKEYAQGQAADDGALFGLVYQVKPRSRLQEFHSMDNGKYEGYKLGETPRFPTSSTNFPYLGDEAGLAPQEVVDFGYRTWW